MAECLRTLPDVLPIEYQYAKKQMEELAYLELQADKQEPLSVPVGSDLGSPIATTGLGSKPCALECVGDVPFAKR